MAMKSQPDKSLSYSVLAAGVLGLKTNVSNFKWSFGINYPRASREAFEDCKIKIGLFEESTDVIDRRVEQASRGNEHGKYHYFSGRKNKDYLLYSRRFMFHTELRLFCEGWCKGEPVFYVNPPYLNFIRHRIMNLHSVGYILTDMVVLELLRRELVALHCSAFRKDGNTVVVFAPPNTGKTLTAMTACSEMGAEFISEDLAITDGKTIYSVPWTSTFEYYDELQKTAYSRVKERITEYIPLFELLPIQESPRITNFVSHDSIVESSDVTHIVVLERGKKAIERPETQVLWKKIANLNRFEFKYDMSPFNIAYDYFHDELDLEGARRREHSILEELIENAQDAVIVRCKSPTEYAAMIASDLL